MYTREQVKTIVEKIVNMAKADSVEVNLSGNERTATRWARSSITVNMVQYDRNVTANVRFGQKQGSASTKDFSDAGLKAMVDEAVAEAKAANDSPNLPELLGPQTYVPVDAALPDMVNFGPLPRARMVKQSIDLTESLKVVGSGYIPHVDQTNCTANSKGLFAYYRSADAGFVLTTRTPDEAGSGWAGITGVKDLKLIDVEALTRTASNKALKSRNAQAIEPGRYTVILEPRANARFLSLMTGIFNGGGGGGGGGRGGRGGAPGAPPDSAAAAAPAGRAGGQQVRRVGDKILSEHFSLKSDIGNPILRQTPILGDNRPAASVQWVEKGVLKNFTGGQPAGTGNSLVMDGTNLSIEDMIKQTRRGLLVTFFWYIRGVPAEGQPLLNTGMTRDGLFLIENGEITRPVQNFRWNMSPLVGYNNMTLVGKPVPIHMGESYDGGGTALIPPVRIEEFYMTSVSPAVSP